MLIIAEQKYTRQTARKVREVANAVVKMSIKDAIVQLGIMDRRASIVVLKTLRQAIANAINNHDLQMRELSIKSILVNQGPTYKRWRPVSRGRAHTIFKRSCHIKVVLESSQEATKSKPKKKIDKKMATSKSKVKATASAELSDKKVVTPVKNYQKVVKSNVKNNLASIKGKKDFNQRSK